MDFNIETIFLPSIGVDLVMNIDSLMPLPRASIIHDVDFSRKTITIAQPRIPFTETTQFDQLHLTTIIRTEKRRVRVGISCRPVQFIDTYRLAGDSTDRAIVVQYELPVKETNIRSAYRLSLSSRYTIRAKLICGQLEYHTPIHFRVRDISLSGASLVIPKKVKQKKNPLIGLALNEKLVAGISLVDAKKEQPVATFALKFKVVRMNLKHTDTTVLAGLKTIKLAKKDEDALSDFIHAAQIHQLSRFESPNS
ncbi:hypothetical protein [Desulfospira joergensenii]|uniref:hypothetical protein n=1 Tax=Desulfospira joergensenii TaxID=53329 RepID=UPI0003B50CDB|nr:hypothetical protein [Desulfospira joergensenii]